MAKNLNKTKNDKSDVLSKTTRHNQSEESIRVESGSPPLLFLHFFTNRSDNSNKIYPLKLMMY